MAGTSPWRSKCWSSPFGAYTVEYDGDIGRQQRDFPTPEELAAQQNNFFGKREPHMPRPMDEPWTKNEREI
jgi:hypothetical protein